MNKKNFFKKIKSILLNVSFVLIHLFLFKYIYNIFGLELHNVNIYIFLNYIYLMIKLYVLKYNPEDKEINKVIHGKNSKQISLLKGEVISNLRLNMVENYKFIFKMFCSIDLQNMIFCVVLAKTTNIASVYFKIFFILNLLCSFPIYRRMLQSYSLREMEQDFDELFEKKIYTLQEEN